VVFLEGVKKLHICGVVHHRLKTANVLLAALDLMKIADLGTPMMLFVANEPVSV
jgi:serine/threonine protein kinase